MDKTIIVSVEDKGLLYVQAYKDCVWTLFILNVEKCTMTVVGTSNKYVETEYKDGNIRLIEFAKVYRAFKKPCIIDSNYGLANINIGILSGMEFIHKDGVLITEGLRVDNTIDFRSKEGYIKMCLNDCNHVYHIQHKITNKV